MIRRIELVNFMSHVHTVLEPADGLTVLVGPNNCGKSAVVAALQILCHNENSTYVMRHDERACSVTVTTDDGHVIQWRRKNSPAYVLDGQEFSRLERGSVPAEVQRVLRLPKISPDPTREFDVHFGEQRSPVFLIDQPGSQAAQFFASSSDAASLVEMQKLHQQRMQDARGERKRLEHESLKRNAELSVLSATDEISLRVAAIESAHEAIQRQETIIERLEHDQLTLRRTGEMLSTHHAEAAALAPLCGPPTLESPEPIAALSSRIRSTQTDLERYDAHSGVLGPLRPPPELHPEAPLHDLIRDIRHSERVAERLRAESHASQALVPPPLLGDASALSKLVDELIHTDARIARSAATLAAVEKLSPPSEVIDIAPMSNLARELLACVDACSRHERELANIEALIVQTEQDASRLARHNPACPTCGRTLDAAHVLANHAMPARTGDQPGSDALA